MLFSFNWPSEPLEVNKELLRKECGFDDVDERVLSLLPSVIPAGGALYIGFIEGSRVMPEVEQATPEMALAFFRAMRVSGDPWLSPSPERCETYVIVPAAATVRGARLAIVTTRRCVGEASEQVPVVSRRLTVITRPPIATDWLIRRVA